MVWNGRILEIDLTTQTNKTYPLDMEMARLFIGGRGEYARHRRRAIQN